MAMPMLRMPWGELVAWTGEWPPPERLYMVIGRRTGGRSFTDDDILEREGLTLEQIAEVGYVTVLERKNYSRLPDEIDASKHVFRGADYVEVETLTPA